MKLRQVRLDHKFHKLSRGFCFQKLNLNIFQSKFDFSCSTAGCQGVAAGDRRKITKMTAESSGMVGFHFLKKEKTQKNEPDRMSYSYLVVNATFGGQKLTFVSNSGFPDRAQTLTLTLTISRMRIFLANRRWLTSYLTRITHLRKFEWILPQIF